MDSLDELDVVPVWASRSVIIVQELPSDMALEANLPPQREHWQGDLQAITGLEAEMI